MMVGADVENGLYSILGARQGCYKTMCTEWDHTQTRDFLYLNKLWEESDFHSGNVVDRITDIGTLIRNELDVPLAVHPYDNEQSEFFKTVYKNSDRVIRRK
jgi:hypothetical protein